MNDVIATSKKTAALIIEDAHQGEIFKETQKERIGNSKSEVQVSYSDRKMHV